MIGMAFFLFLLSAGIVLVAAYVLFKMKYYPLHVAYLESPRR